MFFHLPFLSLMPMLLSPLFGSRVYRAAHDLKKILLFGGSVSVLSFAVFCIPILPFDLFWNTQQLCAVILLPTVLTAVLFWTGVFWAWFSEAYTDSPYVIALQQMRSFWIYFLCVLSLQLVWRWFPELNYFSDGDVSWLWAFGYYPVSLLMHPIACAVLGRKIKRNAEISVEKGLCFGMLVFFLFIGMQLLYVMPQRTLDAEVIRFYVWEQWEFWMLPPACTAIAFTAAVLLRKKGKQ